MATIHEDVFLGKTEKYNQKLEMLAKMAQPEKWTYKRIQEQDPFRILRNYTFRETILSPNFILYRRYCPYYHKWYYGR